LNHFKSCFSRQSAFKWFVVIIGLITRSDKLGTTSVIRDLALNPKLYETMNQPSGWDSNHFKLEERGIYNSSPCRADD
jgi:hypothetical protein